MTRNTQAIFRIDFSLRREIFFVVIGAVLGAVTMVVPITFLYTGLGLPYYLTWMAFGHVIGVYSFSFSSIIALLILGGGFGVIEVLRQLQKAVQDDVDVDITLVS